MTHRSPEMDFGAWYECRIVLTHLSIPVRSFVVFLSFLLTHRKTSALSMDKMPLHSSYVESLITYNILPHHFLFHLLSKPQLENGPHAPVYQLLNLFAYGTYCDYKGIAAAAQCK